jgi:hypothetical protein
MVKQLAKAHATLDACPDRRFVDAERSRSQVYLLGDCGLDPISA